MAPLVGISGIGLVVGREWENFMALSQQGSFSGSHWDSFSGWKKSVITKLEVVFF